MNILLLGSGGREHVFATKLIESPLCDQLYIAPGNAGTAQCGTNLNISPLNFGEIEEAVRKFNIEMIVPGNEDPLVAGLVDYFENKCPHVLVPGPSKAAARLEGSKDFSKILMTKYGIPTASYMTVEKDNAAKGEDFIRSLKPPYVLKADGLAAGKGVLILEEADKACDALHEMLNGKFGAAGKKVVIEEFLHGIEVSCFALCDGAEYIILPEAKDYKRIGEGDTGPNTGGMGAISPVPFADAAFMQKVEEQILKPTLNGLLNEGIPYRGFLFMGLMNTGGEPKVIEYNCRMGDPETEVVLHRIQSDVTGLLTALCRGELKDQTLKISEQTAATVVLVSEGYPGEYKKGMEISGLDEVSDSMVYHAGTKLENGKILSSGGRVLAVTSMGADLKTAIDKSMSAAEQIKFEGKTYRKDIGKDLLQYYEQV